VIAGRVHVRVVGAVQGVGFRPFVYRLATEHQLAGWVRNTSAGVEIEVEGEPPVVARFVERLSVEPPALARVESVTVAELSPLGERGFAIRASDPAARADACALVLPDLATCDECVREIFDPAARRFRYPFTNCTRCGPRFSIVRRLPYDRPHTTMAGFAMCEACRAEYDDPADRRFHAQPIACPRCGPTLVLRAGDGRVIATADEALRAACDAIRAGRIVAIKGLGGFQLVVRARDAEAVATLRARKHRPHKPFAVMVGSLAAARALVRIADAEAALLASPAAPIVLADAIADAVAPGVAPDQRTLGIMLPTTPLHHLLVAELAAPIVATSGNRSEEPICVDDDEARARLGDIADLFLGHDRPIARATDDSVARVVDGQVQTLRAGRGLAPLVVDLPAATRGALALGPHLKNTVAVAVRGRAIASGHVGDLDHPLAVDACRRATADLAAMWDVAPERVACDAHPEYTSTRLAEAQGLPVVRVQHHLAHALAIVADRGLTGPLCAVVWDGTGAGPDGTVWGGEVLVTSGDRAWRRLAHLRRFRMLGGDAAARDAFRAAAALLHELDLPWTPPAELGAAAAQVIATMLARGVNAPWTSSAGRLFDGIASLLGLCQRQTYEGQAAIRLEARVDRGSLDPYPIALVDCGAAPTVIDWAPLVRAVIADRDAGVAIAQIAARVHDGLAAAIADVARRAGAHQVVLGGGCFQNRVLTERACARLRAAGHAPFVAARVPPNDGGIALGQLVAAVDHHVLEGS